MQHSSWSCLYKVYASNAKSMDKILWDHVNQTRDVVNIAAEEECRYRHANFCNKRAAYCYHRTG